jgi:hypothetical protein
VTPTTWKVWLGGIMRVRRGKNAKLYQKNKAEKG